MAPLLHVKGVGTQGIYHTSVSRKSGSKVKGCVSEINKGCRIEIKTMGKERKIRRNDENDSVKPVDLFAGGGGVNRIIDLHWFSCCTIPFPRIFPKRVPDLFVNPFEHALWR